MSTDLHRDPTAGEPLRSLDELREGFAAGCKPESRWGIGLEYERVGVFRDTGLAIPYHGPRSVRALLEGMAEHHGWTAHREDDNPIALTRGQTSITLEPGGQTELSGGIHTDLQHMRDELCTYLSELSGLSAPMNIAWLGIGLQPFSRRDDIEWVPKSRYGVMSAHLQRTGKLALDMMKRTAGIQVNFDYKSEEDAAEKLRALMAVSPLITALFANSPLQEGEPTGFMSQRAEIWRHTDPARSGLLQLAFDQRPLFAAYTDYALDVPMMFVVRDGRWIAVDVPFRRYMAEGHQGLTATRGDWNLHLTTLFPDVRLKTFLEARFADSGDAALAMAHVALIKGLVYDEEATGKAWKLVADLDWDQRLALHADVARHGLAARTGVHSAAELAGELLVIARDGLRRQQAAQAGAADETPFLGPLEIILESKESPARRLLRLWDERMHRRPEALVEHLARTNLDCYTCDA